MTIQLTNAGKRFNRDWIFRNLTYTFAEGNTYAITGNNGSGKSTLLQVIAGSMDASEGIIERFENGQKTDSEMAYRQFAIAAPYIEVIEEMTALEFLTFHSQFKPFGSIAPQEILQIIGLEKAANKQIRYFSSGMKQRIKLAQAMFSNVPLVLLDEPCTNLDSSGFELYHRMVKTYCKDKTIIVSSNDKNEYSFCKEIVEIGEYK